MKYLFYILLCAGSLSSCSKDIKVDSPDLTVGLSNFRSRSADTLIFQLGDTCKFTFSNYADNIAFYSGQGGYIYENRERTTAFGTPVLSFSSTKQWGVQENTLKVLATKSLAKIDSVNIVNAAWTDITDKARLATSSSVMASGDISLAELVSSASDSLIIAFKYNGTSGSTQRTWTITNFFVRNVLPDGSYTIGSLADVAYWTIFNTGSSVVNWTASSSQLSLIGGPASNPSNESWIVSRPMYVGRISPDVPARIIKSVNSAEVSSYAFEYPEAGVYKATFVISNNSIDDTRSKLTEYIIKVVE